MSWADNGSGLPSNFISDLVQLKSLERCLVKKPELKNNYTRKITIDLDKSYIVKIDKQVWFKVDCPREWYLPPHPVFHPHKPGKVRRVLNGAAKFQGSSFINPFLTGPDFLQNLVHVLIRCC